MINLTHSNLRQRHAEIRFDLHDTLSDLRQRIHTKTGTPAIYQHLQVKDTNNVKVCDIPPSTSPQYKLGYFSLQHGMTIHCIDLDEFSGSRGGQYEDVSLVQKYTLSDEEYNRRSNTLRSWSRQQQELDPNFTLQRHAKQHQQKVEQSRREKMGLSALNTDKDDSNTNETQVNSQQQQDDQSALDTIQVGMRCEVQPGGRRGEVMYVGQVEEIGGGGWWVGVKFDEPVGKSDGSVRGKPYFQALPGYGGFVRAKNISVGDYPEQDILQDDSSSEDEL